MKCPSCSGSGREYNAADHSSSNCDECGGSGIVPERAPKTCFYKQTVGTPMLTMTCVTEA